MHQQHDHASGGTEINEEDKAICPVMRIPVSKQEAIAKDLTREYKGKNYYLCCRTCESMFDSNPTLYIAKEGV